MKYMILLITMEFYVHTDADTDGSLLKGVSVTFQLEFFLFHVLIKFLKQEPFGC